ANSEVMAELISVRRTEARNIIHSSRLFFQTLGREFEWRGSRYDASDPRVLVKIDGNGVRWQLAIPANAEAPDPLTMTNVEIWRDRACCFTGTSQLWLLDLTLFTWLKLDVNRGSNNDEVSFV
ncbi:hypothetical protein PFISCL1PPCAC_9100, partial [Pristionchus fissidentatus]